jgi:ATP-dependent DNA helicase PIF1
MKRPRENEEDDLSPEQKSVVEAVNAGMNVFFTGSAGTGKSYTLRRIINLLQNKYDTKTVHVTASTGIAATNIGGTTLHSYASIGLGNEPVDIIMKRLTKFRGVADRWRATRVLIIDEISMLSTEFFVKLDLIAKRIRANRSPFGGIQLVLSGDFDHNILWRR